MLGIAVQGMGSILSLRQRGTKDFNRRCKLRLKLHSTFKRRHCLAYQTRRADVCFNQIIQRGLYRTAQHLRIRQAAMLSIQLTPLRKARRQLVNFADLPGQSIYFTLQAVLSRASLGQCLL